MTDFVLAVIHHVLVFTFVGLLAAELALVRPGLTASAARRLAQVDMAYGALAGVIIIAGFARVFLGDKGSAYYFGAWTFWAKIAAFAAAGILSIGPTMQFVRWSRAGRENGSFAVPVAEVSRIRRFMLAEVAALVLVPVFAAAMARGLGL